MPTCTPIYGLPYPQGSDAPCDQSETWCGFAAAVDSELTRLDRVVDRVVDTIPQFQLSVAGYTFLDAGSRTVGFDTLGADTDDMVNLATDPFTAVINTPGRWHFYFRVITNGNTALSGNIPASVVNTPSLGVITITQDYQDNGTNYPVSIDGSGFYRYPAAGTKVSLNVNTAATAIISATFGGYWVGDL